MGWRLSTQIGVVFFVGMALIAGMLGWQSYQDSAKRIPEVIAHECEGQADLITAAIADYVNYRKPYPLWLMLNRSVKESSMSSVFRLKAFSVVDSDHMVLADSAPLKHPLQTRLELPTDGIRWQGRELEVVHPIFQPSSHRQVGRILLRYHAVAIDQQLAREKRRLAYMMLAALLFALLAAAWARILVAAPLRVLSATARKVGSGSAVDDAQLHDGRPLEVRDLANAIAAADAAVNESTRQVSLLASVVAQADEMVLVTDANGVITYVNPAFERCTGYRASEAIGKKPNIVKSGEHNEAYYAEMWQTITSGGVWWDIFKNRRKDGSIYIVEQSIFPVLDSDGQVMAYAAVQQDVTERRRVEEKLRHTDRVESLGLLAGGIAHDFNNLLTSILGNAALALKKLDKTSPAWSHIEHIEAASHSSADLCRQMLAYSGKGRFVVQPINLSNLIENMGKLVEVSVPRNVGMRYVLADPLPSIDADVAQMQQVILNLLTNASEAIGEESGTITLATGVMEADARYLKSSFCNEHVEPGDFVFLEVCDTGCGMDMETQEKIFDPFFTTKSVDKGTGLGLSVVYGIIKSHDGYIEVESETGKGTIFHLYFKPVEAMAEQPSEVQFSGYTNGNENILEVDDEAGIRDMLSELLISLGYNVLLAKNGNAAVETVRNNKEIYVAIVDYAMPKMNGIETIKAIHQVDGNIRILLSSGYADQARIIHKYPNIDGFLPKPYHINEVARIVKETLKKRVVSENGD
jgi:PAS domain S-box-containing protein